MSDSATRPFYPFTAPDRAGAIAALRVAWDGIAKISDHVQQLDSPVVRYDVWGRQYADAQAQLDDAILCTYDWPRSPYPVENAALRSLEGLVRDELRATQRLVRAFEWSHTQAVLYSTGAAVLAIAETMGVEL